MLHEITSCEYSEGHKFTHCVRISCIWNLLIKEKFDFSIYQTFHGPRNQMNLQEMPIKISKNAKMFPHVLHPGASNPCILNELLCVSSRFSRTFTRFYTYHIQNLSPNYWNHFKNGFMLVPYAWFSCGVLDCTACSSSEALTNFPPTNFLIAVNNRAWIGKVGANVSKNLTTSIL